MLRGIAAAIALFLALGFLTPSASAHPYHLQVSNEVLVAPERVEADSWIAQSFLAPADFLVSRISVYAADTGASDSLEVSIRSTGPLNLPHTTIITEGMIDGPPGAGWLDVELSPRSPLAASTTYWIVAHSAVASSGDGYDWWHSGTESAFPDGIGATSSDGGLWSPRGRDFAFRVYGFSQPSLTFDASTSSPSVRQGAFIDVHVNVSNAGPGIAQAVWVNVSLPPQLAFVTDDAPVTVEVIGGAYSYRLANLTAGSTVFRLTLQAATNVLNGTHVLVRVAINATDHNGFPLPSFIRNLGIEIAGGVAPPLPPVDQTWWWLLAVPFFAGGAYYIWRGRSRRIIVDEVFVGDAHGILLAHRSAFMVHDKDEDILVGMFKAIQDFVRDTFSRGVEEEFHALEFGERRVLIERSRSHFIAVVYRGENRENLEQRVRKVSQSIEAAFGDVIASWDGDVDTVKGITHLISRIWGHRA